MAHGHGRTHAVHPHCSVRSGAETLVDERNVCAVCLPAHLASLLPCRRTHCVCERMARFVDGPDANVGLLAARCLFYTLVRWVVLRSACCTSPPLTTSWPPSVRCRTLLRAPVE